MTCDKNSMVLHKILNLTFKATKSSLYRYTHTHTLSLSLSLSLSRVEFFYEHSAHFSSEETGNKAARDT